MTYRQELARVVEAAHGAALHVRTVRVEETFQGRPAWVGDVEVFALTTHPKAILCFAWGVRRDDDKGWDVTTVLGVPPVTTPELAVKAAIVAHARQAAAQQ